MSGLEDLRSKISSAIASHDTLQNELNVARHLWDTASKELSNLKQSGLPSNNKKVISANKTLDSSKKRLNDAQNNLNQVRDTINTSLQDFVQNDPHKILSLLDPTIPILLFPIRIETKFVQKINGGIELRIRIFPDKIQTKSHEDGLSQSEIAALTQYQKDLTSADGDATTLKNAWNNLVTSCSGPERAAYVVKQDPATIQQKGGSWTKPPTADLLPDQWIIYTCKQGGAPTLRYPDPTKNESGTPIAFPLPVGPDPQANIDTSSFPYDQNLAWLVDFDSALKNGMAVKFDLTSDEISNGIDRLFVIGVKAALKPDDASKKLSDLFVHHIYTNGFAFVRNGTPTNNSGDVKSGYTSVDPGSANSYKTQFGKGDPTSPQPLFKEVTLSAGLPLMTDYRNMSDAQLTAVLLGIDWNIFKNVENADMTEQMYSRYMAAALWPSTMGYFLEQMMSPFFLTGQIPESARKHFINYVRSIGPLPAFRVGKIPYGILPVSSLTSFSLSPYVDQNQKLDAFFGDLINYWKSLTSMIPKVGTTKDPDDELVKVLGMEGLSLNFFTRDAVGADYLTNLINFTGSTYADQWNTYRTTILAAYRTALGNLEKDIPDGRIFQMIFHSESYPLLLPLVTDEPLSETAGLVTSKDYINALQNSQIGDISTENYAGLAPKPVALLYKIMRASLLLAYYNAAFSLLLKDGLVSPSDKIEPELINMDANNPTITVWDRFQQKTSVTGSDTLEQYLDKARASKTSISPEIDDILAALEGLRQGTVMNDNVPTAMLERLMIQTLDTCNFRLDAWITSFATRQLETQRLKKNGIYLGAYGWVEKLGPPDKSSASQIQSDGTLSILPDTIGYVHAPSHPHAVAAAVLRNYYANHVGTPQQDQLSIDLTSNKVKDALRIQEGIRNGQPLGAILGYQFERGLHDNGLDRYRLPFETLYPITQTPETSTTQPTETINPRNVVDGKILLDNYKAGTIPFGSNNLPPVSNVQGSDYDKIKSLLDDLDQTTESLADLNLAESVYQLAQANYQAAAANLDAGNGSRPPESGIIKTPRTGISIDHRVLIVFPDKPANIPSWKPSNKFQNPRATAEPYLNGWLGEILGDPSTVSCSVIYSSNKTTTQVLLSDLNLSPLDFLNISTTSSKAQFSELEQRVLYQALKGVTPLPDPSTVQIQFKTGSGRTFPNMLEFVRSLRDLIYSIKPLDPKNMTRPESSGNATFDIQDLVNREQSLEKPLMKIIQLADPTAKSSLLDSNWLATQFQPTSAQCDCLGVYVGVIGSPASDLILDLREDNSGVPDSSVISSVSMRAADVLSIPSWKYFPPSTKLDTSKKYWIVLHQSGDIKNTFTWYQDGQNTETNATSPDGKTWTPTAASFGFLFLQLKSSDISQALFNSSYFGVPNSLPVTPFGIPETDVGNLVEKLNNITKELTKRYDSLVRIPSYKTFKSVNPPTNPSDYSEVIGWIQTLLGSKFKVLPRFTLNSTDQTELSVALAGSDNLVNNDSDVSVQWFQQMSHVRGRLAKYADMMIYANILTPDTDLSFQVAQLQYKSGDTWAALPFRKDPATGKLIKPDRGHVSLVIDFTDGYDKTQTEYGGFQIDQWSEFIPNEEEMTEIALHHNDPVSEAPQTLLLALAPQTKNSWQLDDLASILNDTFDLAAIRSVDPDILTGLAQILPALYFADNTRGATISTDFGEESLIQQDAAMQEALRIARAQLGDLGVQ